MHIEELLKLSVSRHASDLHLFPGMPPLMRIDGELRLYQEKEPLALTSEEIKSMLYHILTEEQKNHFEQDLVSDFSVSFSQIGNFRISILHQIRGIGAVFRVISEAAPTIEEAGLPSILKRLATLAHGLVLLTGPTGSGKSTTLAAIVEYINVNLACHIITIEDPIEYIYKNKKSIITQIQVGRDTHSFATALKSSLRQDPDVILLGEIRDLESIRLALIAAEAGHLVLTTLHANSAPLAISRIIDVFPPDEKNRIRNMLSETIQAILCQTLVKKTAGGRIAAFEILLANPAIRHSIHQDMTAQMETIMQTNNDIGMCTMAQYLKNLMSKGIINSTAMRSIDESRNAFKTPVMQKPS